MPARFTGWLSSEAIGPTALLAILGAFALVFIKNVFAAFVLYGMGYTPTAAGTADIINMTVFVLFYMAIIEEIVFRLAPIALTVPYFGLRWQTFLVIALSSVIFGWLHGGWIQVPIQGVSGLIYSFLFLKCGGSSKRLFKPLLCTTTAHTMQNLTLITLMRMGA